jgi:hypothetical protein
MQEILPGIRLDRRSAASGWHLDTKRILFILFILPALSLLLNTQGTSQAPGQKKKSKNYTKLFEFTGMSNSTVGLSFESPGPCAAASGSQQLGATSTRPYPGTSFSIEQWYQVAPLGVNGCADHQDANLHIEYVTPDYPNGPGFEWIGIDTLVYIQPYAGSSKNIQRKLFWAGLKYDQGSPYPPDPGFRAVVTSDGDDSNLGARFTAQGSPVTGPSGSMYGQHSEVAPPPPTNIGNGTTAIPYNSWVRLTLILKRRTDFSLRDSEVYFYQDGVLTFQKTNTWSPDDVTLCPMPRGGSTSQICVPWPGDQNSSLFPDGWTWLWFGTQVDRLSSATAPTIDEKRFFGPTKICGSNGALTDMKTCLGL